ncbi:MAG: hypothetical protein SVM79_09600 [Chloroflexota bacterium]|nr:hypothetical protein [Chloroflexota bacterium]
MAEAMFSIFGHVVGKESGQGIAGLQVEAWNKSSRLTTLLGNAVTDATGAFYITFDESSLKGQSAGAAPNVFFRVLQGEDVLESTEGTLLWNPEASGDEIVIRIEQPASAAGDGDAEVPINDKTALIILTGNHRITGRISIESGTQVSDHIAVDTAFVTVLDAEVSDHDGRVILTTPFMKIRWQSIEAIIPAEVATIEKI